MNGSLPKRFFLAATCCRPIFSTPGSVNSPEPFLCTDARMAASSEAKTALTALSSTPACSARCAISVVLLKAVLMGFSAAGVAATGLAAAAGTFLAAGAAFFAAGAAFLATGAAFLAAGAAALVTTFFAGAGVFFAVAMMMEVS
ncbi:hypothetical protein D3C71_1582420 [compost metagenome]